MRENQMSHTKSTTAEGKPEKVFINRKFYDQDFSQRDLTHGDFRGCTLVSCNFDNSDLSYATFEGANCYRSTFRQSSLYHASFKDAVLAECTMDPRNAMGVTISLNCDTFDKVKIGSNWMAAWLYYPLVADIPEEVRTTLTDMVRNMLGEEKFNGLERHFKNRLF
jgi:uncharacterized protein YjbI with pentapeptide repeats